jgi:hypothetical protein
MATERAPRGAPVPTPPLPAWLVDSIKAIPSPVREQLLGFAAASFDAGYQLGHTDARKRRRQPPPEQPQPAGQVGTDG